MKNKIFISLISLMIMLCSCSNSHSYVFEYVGIIQNVEFDKYTQRAGYEGVTVVTTDNRIYREFAYCFNGAAIGDTLLYSKETFSHRAFFTYKKKD